MHPWTALDELLLCLEPEVKLPYAEAPKDAPTILVALLM